MKHLIAPALLLASSLAHGVTLDNGDKAINSQAFQLYGTCTGGDMVYKWTIAGKSAGVWNLHPWLPAAAYIVGVELLDMTPADGHGWWMVGNNMQGDPMVYMSASENRVSNWYPAGASWRVPPMSDDTPLTYIDLHGLCKAGAWATLMVTFYYVQP